MERMKRALFVLFLAQPAFATWAAPDVPTYTFDGSGNVLSVSDCAKDTVTGNICVSITADSTGAALVTDGTGNLKNQANVQTAITNALNAARTAILAAQTKKTTDTTNAGKITLTAPAISGT